MLLVTEKVNYKTQFETVSSRTQKISTSDSEWMGDKEKKKKEEEVASPDHSDSPNYQALTTGDFFLIVYDCSYEHSL